MHPYKEEGQVRTFSKDVKEHSLVWHRDREDRIVEVIEGTGWRFQFDNDIPQAMEGKTFFIPKGTYHRIIKGETDLIINVKKLVY